MGLDEAAEAVGASRNRPLLVGSALGRIVESCSPIPAPEQPPLRGGDSQGKHIQQVLKVNI